MIKSRHSLALLAMFSLGCVGALTKAQSLPLSLEQRMLLRCSATFALVADAQSREDEAVNSWPDMSERGRRFFVRASASVMDEAQLDRDAIAAILATEAQDIAQSGTLDEMMRVCLPLLPGPAAQTSSASQ